MINANNYDTLAAMNDSFYVLADDKGRYFARDFDKPSTEHTMFCTHDVREATRYKSEEDAQMARTNILSWHTTNDDVNHLAKEIVNVCKPMKIYHSEKFTVPKGVMVRDAGFGQFANSIMDAIGG